MKREMKMTDDEQEAWEVDNGRVPITKLNTARVSKFAPCLTNSCNAPKCTTLCETIEDKPKVGKEIERVCVCVREREKRERERERERERNGGEYLYCQSHVVFLGHYGEKHQHVLIMPTHGII